MTETNTLTCNRCKQEIQTEGSPSPSIAYYEVIPHSANRGSHFMYAVYIDPSCFYPRHYHASCYEYITREKDND